MVIDELIRLLADLAGTRDVLGRELVCTPFGGCYGLAGWVLAVNGSPPRGILVVGTGIQGDIPAPVVWIKPLFIKSRRLAGERQLAIVRRFYQEHLAEAREAFELHPGQDPSGRRGADSAAAAQAPAPGWTPAVSTDPEAAVVGGGKTEVRDDD